jgi:hypothetical protein
MFHDEMGSGTTWTLCAALLRILLFVGRCGDNSELMRDSTKPSDLLMESQNLRTRWVSERSCESRNMGNMDGSTCCMCLKKEGIAIYYTMQCCRSGMFIRNPPPPPPPPPGSRFFFHSGPRIQDPTTTIIGVKK